MTARALAYLPGIAMFRSYRAAWLRPDLIAGITAWAMVVPEGMAYAGIAGVPVEAGLYCAFIPPILYWLLGTGRTLTVGPASATAIMSAATIAPLAAGGSSEYVALTAALALLMGLICVLAGVLRLGFIVNFISHPVLQGFITGLAMVIIVGQLPKLFGVEKADGEFWEQAWGLIGALADTDAATLAVGAGACALLVALDRLLPRLPAALICVAAGIAVVSIFGLESELDVVGEVPAGLPDFSLPDVGWGDVDALLGGALALVLVGYSETISTGRIFAEKRGEPIDPNQEFLALGFANVSAGVSQGFACDCSLTRSSVKDRIGVKTTFSAAITGVATLLTMLFLTGVFSDLPEAVLGAIVVVNVVPMLRLRTGRRLLGYSNAEFAAWLATIAGVTILGELPGLVIGVLLSLVILIARASSPPVRALGFDATEQAYVAGEIAPEHGVVVARIDGDLFFANALPVHDSLEELVGRAGPVTALLLDLESVSSVDLTAAEELLKLQRGLEQRGVALALARVKAAVREDLAAAAVIDAVGERRVFRHVADGVAALAG